MSLYQRLKLRLRIFGDDQKGSMPAEGVMAATFLIWWYIASFQFFDAYRQKNVNLKAAYTIADMLSRQTDPVGPRYVGGLNKVFDYLTYSRKPTEVRVSSVYWDDSLKQYRVLWSYSSGTRPIQTDATLQSYKNQIPVMSIGDTTVIVETFMAYEPIFSIGLKAQWFNTFIVTRPRFAPQVVYDAAA